VPLTPVTSNTAWVESLARAPLSERSALLEALVVGEFRAWLLMSEADALPLDESYFALGLTSLGAVEIQERLESILGRRIDSSSLFNNPTIDHLLLHLRDEVLAGFFQARQPAEPDAVQPGTDERRHREKQLLASVLDELFEI
jgi:aryl carrier-like protein